MLMAPKKIVDRAIGRKGNVGGASGEGTIRLRAAFWMDLSF